MAKLTDQQIFEMQQAEAAWMRTRGDIETFGGSAFIVGLVALVCVALSVVHFISIPLAITSFLVGFCTILYVSRQDAYHKKQQETLAHHRQDTGKSIDETHYRVLTAGLRTSKSEDDLRKLNHLPTIDEAENETSSSVNVSTKTPQSDPDNALSMNALLKRKRRTNDPKTHSSLSNFDTQANSLSPRR